MYSRCYLCGEEVETVNHLFLQCRIISQLWRIFISLRGFAWAMPNRITHLLYSWGEVGVGAADRDGGLSQPVSCELFGKKEMLDVLRARIVISKRSNKIVSGFFVSGASKCI